ncbi:hypothetical protein FOT57_23415 [Serratia ureilytica]|uniref:hypothetical protein n=1 Tax=Serratia ureilytica TaxID=300181 RepID=UPI0011C8F9A6|nr:hypothetical protein [Serratia ureilytica]TXE51168.1 hypothetical protein FOT57_23415 [Serratia ureilytica]
MTREEYTLHLSKLRQKGDANQKNQKHNINKRDQLKAYRKSLSELIKLSLFCRRNLKLYSIAKKTPSMELIEMINREITK